MEEQRARVRSSVPAERFAAALLLSGVLAGRLRELGDLELGQVLDREICSSLSVLAPELTVCMEAADRLCRRGADKTLRPRRSQATKHDDGDHLLHAEQAQLLPGFGDEWRSFYSEQFVQSRLRHHN